MVDSSSNIRKLLLLLSSTEIFEFGIPQAMSQVSWHLKSFLELMLVSMCRNITEIAVVICFSNCKHFCRWNAFYD